MSLDELTKETEDKLDNAWFDAQVAIKNRNYHSAIENLELILRIDKKNAAAYNRLAIVYAKLKQWRRSTRYFRAAVKLEPSESAWHNLGLIYYQRRHYDKSIIAFHKSLHLTKQPSAARHLAIAKTFEKMTYYQQTLEHLKKAAEIETSPQMKAIYIDAYKKYSIEKKLSDEIVESLVHTKTDWELDNLDKYPILIDTLSSIGIALGDLIHSKPLTKLSRRSKNTNILSVAYVQNLGACTNLLNKNYSLAATNIARSMFEIYLKIGYGLNSKTNRNYALQELDTLKNKLGANNRMLRQILPADSLYRLKLLENSKLQSAINSLNRQYVSVNQAPSYRQMAVVLDNGSFSRNYALYERLYEKGSDAIHADGNSISRIIDLSGARQTGLFIDSFELLNRLVELSHALGELYLTLPEVSQASKKKYTTRMRKLGYRHT